MKRYTAEELAEVLRLHSMWLCNEPGGVRADLSMANLSRANLSGANLSDANLSGADLSRASLGGAYLSRASLGGAYLGGANLSMAQVDNAILPAFQIVPETGSFDGWKKLSDGHIAHLRIPASAGRVSSTGRKCRAEYAKVIAIYTPAGKKVPRSTEVGGHRDTRFMYTPGKVVRPDKWNPDIRVECTYGIHFFLTRKEAEEYGG